LLVGQALSAEARLVKLRVRVALIDKDLKVNPVPKQTFALLPQGGGKEISFTTGFDGLAELQLPAGRYKLRTAQPVEFQGKNYAWELELALEQAENSLELSNDNAKVTEASRERAAGQGNDLTSLFKRLQNTVVTVRSEFGSGTGFIVDAKGLVLTNQHVLGPSEYVAVQFDERRKVRAVELASDAQKDVAVLWIALSAFPQARVAAVAKGQGSEAAVVGERVFTIGSPLGEQKILTTGVVSKVEPQSIISDVNINPGNSGGPLFNSAGSVVGITTYSEQGKSGPGLSGIIPIREADTVLAQAETKMGATAAPTSALLPVEPSDVFPFEAVNAVVQEEKFDRRPYSFDAGDYEVYLATPLYIYRRQQEKARAAAREQQKRAEKKGSTGGAPPSSEEVKNWEKTAEEFKPVIKVLASPKLRETGKSIFLRALTNNVAAAKVRFKTDFYRMRLLCGDKEIQPIHPGKIATRVNVQNRFVNATDATYEGFYTYPFDAVSPSCGKVVLELYQEKGSTQPTVKVFEEKTVTQVWSDFEAYRKLHGQAAADPASSPK
jgi:S1-C subfamily serine protease